MSYFHNTEIQNNLFSFILTTAFCHLRTSQLVIAAKTYD